MMPISALPALPMPLPVLPAAPVALDFAALLQGGPVAAPAPELAQDEPSAPVAALDIEAPETSETLVSDAQPLPAPPPILAMLHTPAPPAPPAPSAERAPAEAVAVVNPAPGEQAQRFQVDTLPSQPVPIAAPHPEQVAVSAPPPAAPPIATRPTENIVSSATTVDRAPISMPAVRQNAAPSPASVESHRPAGAARAPVVVVMPPTPPVLVAEPADIVLAPVALPIQPDAPRPARGAPVLPPLSAPAPTAEPIPPASPTMREVPSSPPPVEARAPVADAATPEPPAAPDQPAAPLPQPVALAPAQRSAMPDALQPPIDTTDPRWIERMAQEIADIADGDGRTRFRLNPETLGSMEVTVRHTADGISVRFEVDSESTRTLLAHAEQRLQAEARVNGLRIADTQVDLADHGQREGRERPAEQPLIAIRAGQTADSTPSAERTPASARYA
jgi:hypothetical protein